MPIEVGFWKIDRDKVRRIDFGSIDTERRLESLIESDLSIIGSDLMLIGRQVITSFGKIIDLLAMDANGKVSIIELKRSKTPREVVAQAIDYASWIQHLGFDDLKKIYRDYAKKELEEGYSDFFGGELPEHINEEHDMLIVCSTLDTESERIVSYLSERDIPINVVFFSYFKDGESEYMSRSWLIDPAVVEEKASISGAKDSGEAWNGRDFVVNVDEWEGVSTWKDAVKYGFVSAGGGIWYSRTLKQLREGHRVFAYIPQVGYVGVGKVVGTSMSMKDFKVTVDGKKIPILEAPMFSGRIKAMASKNEDETEYLVKVEWIETVDEGKALKGKGLRANQNSAFKLKSAYTLTKLIDFFKLEE